MPSSGASHEAPSSIKTYDESMENELNNFYELSTQIGGSVSEMARFYQIHTLCHFEDVR
jgi:hypothetical protein